MKRIASIVLCLAIMLTSLSQVAIITFAAGTPTITCENKECNPGDSITVEVNIANNPGIMYLELTPVYSNELTLVKAENGSIFTDCTKGKQYVWTADENINSNGLLVKFTFSIDSSVEPGDYSVGFTFRSSYNYDEEAVTFTVNSAKVTVKPTPVPVTGLALDKTTATVETGDETLTLTPIFTPETATNKNVNWESSDEKIATVSNGVVTLIKKGTVTITATTEDGNYSASCVVTINCSHRKGTDYPAVDSTCIAHGHSAYTVCDECGEIISGSDAELPFADHTGGTADCLHKAVCSVCDKEYGELGNHTLTKHDRVEPDHNNTGNIEYYTCDICNKIFSDYLGKNEIKLADTVLAVVPHSYPTTWSNNESGHWKECGCGNKVEFAVHSYDNDCDTTCNICGYTRSITHNYSKTYSSDATQHWHECSVCREKTDIGSHAGGTATCLKKAVCSVCGNEYGELAAHKLTNHKAVAADHFHDGNIEYWTCEVCNGYFKDAAGTVKTNLSGVTIPKINHTFSENWSKDGSKHWHECSCGEKSDSADHAFSNACDTTCDICGYTRTITHSYSSDWTSDGVSHWHVCTVCGDKSDITAHSGGTANCLHKAVCSVCSKEYGELGAHNYIENTDAKYLKSAATCTHKAVYYKSCSVCGEKSTETFEYGNVDSSNHVGGTYVKGQKEASCYEEGYTGDTYCSDCNIKIRTGTVIEKNAHNPAAVWSTDADYHWKDCQTVGCGNIIDKAAHSGGKATCVNKAVCSVCGVEYGSVDSTNHEHTEIRGANAATEDTTGYTGDTYCKDCNTKIAAGTVIPKLDHTHSMTAITAKPATCTAVGNTAYWYCTKCQKYFSDESGKKEIKLSDTVIPMINHSYTVLQSDDNGHWYKCADCDAKTAVTAHSGGTATCQHKAVCSVCGKEYGELGAHNYSENTDTKYLKSAATCTHKAVYYQSCSVCGEKGTNTFEYGEVNSSNHVGPIYKVGQKEATCYEDGYTGDTYCSDCNAKIASGTAISKTAHNPASVWTTDADYHWKECQTVGCGNLIDKAQHSGGTATCTHKAVCSVCGVEYGTVDANNHPNTEVRDAVASTCTKEGYTGDTYCKDCGVKISSGVSIAKTSHNYKTTVVAPTCTEKGYTLHKCADCSDEYKDTYNDAVGHTVVEWTVTKEATKTETGIKTGKCTVCGESIIAETGKLVPSVDKSKLEGNVKASVEAIGDTKLYENVIFKADNITEAINSDNKSDIEKKANGLKIGASDLKLAAVFDLSMILRDTDSKGNVIKDTDFKPNGKVKVSIEIPESVLKTFENILLVHLKDDGTAESIAYTLNGNIATFETDAFSKYAFVGTEVKTPTSSGETGSNTENNGSTNSPQTGDTSNIFLWIALAFVSASALTGITIYSKKKKSR